MPKTVDFLGNERQKSASGLKLGLVDLPIDALLCIFKLCDSSSLRNLSQTCKKLNEIVSEDYLWISRSNDTVITNQLSNKIIKRTSRKLPAKESCRVSANWKHGCYDEKIYNTCKKYMPWLHLESDCLWISRGRSIVALKRIRDGLRIHPPVCTIHTTHTEDISRFVKADDIIFSGGKDKYICGWSTSINKLLLRQKSNHSQDIHGLDCKRHILVSGSKDNTIKGTLPDPSNLRRWGVSEGASCPLCCRGPSTAAHILVGCPVAVRDGRYTWRHDGVLAIIREAINLAIAKVWQVGERGDSLSSVQTLNCSDRVWCVAVNPLVSCVAVGSAGYYKVHPLHLYDLNSGIEITITKSIIKNGAAVFDIHWDCPNTLVTCGFDTITRLWDIRLGACVGQWADPFGAPGYCLATDQRHSMLCGTAHHGRVQLWDKRSPVSVQAYFGRSGTSSPVYSLSFDPRQLFIAQDSCLNVLDFSRHLRPDIPRADYSTYWTPRQTKL